MGRQDAVRPEAEPVQLQAVVGLLRLQPLREEHTSSTGVQQAQRQWRRRPIYGRATEEGVAVSRLWLYPLPEVPTTWKGPG